MGEVTESAGGPVAPAYGQHPTSASSAAYEPVRIPSCIISGMCEPFQHTHAKGCVEAFRVAPTSVLVPHEATWPRHCGSRMWFNGTRFTCDRCDHQRPPESEEVRAT